MNFKTHLIAGACLAACSASSFAVTAVKAVCPAAAPATSADAVAYVNNCAPEYTLFVGGASTQASNFATIIKATVLDSSKMTPIVIVDKGSVSGIGTNVSGVSFDATKSNVRALYGMNSAGKRVLAIYNFNNGSAAGVSQLLGKPTLPSVLVSAGGIPESDVVFVGPAKSATLAGGTAPGTFCAAATLATDTVASTDAAPVVNCTTHTPQQADLALSDTAPAELYAVYSGAKAKLTTLTNTPLFLQSFGVVVSPLLYSALQTKNLADSLIPATCVAGDLTATCQPTIRRDEYASLVAKGGSIKTLAALTGSSLTDPLTLARRDNLSGTQAVSNMFFVNGQCGGNGNGAVLKSLDNKVKLAGGLLGGLAIDDISNSTSSLNILSAVVSGDVKNAVASATGDAIGVLNVGGGGTVSNSDTSVTAKGRFVKIDGLSPNFNGAGATGAAVTRAQIATGNYPFAFTAYGSYVTASYGKMDATKKALVDNALAGFKSSSLTDLSGVAYLDGAVSAKQSAVNRTAGNNCSPITKL